MKIINAAVFNDLLAKADASSRKRSNFNLHESSCDVIQRYLVAAKIDSYFRPHMHRTRFELAIVLRGKFDLLLFNERAVLTERISLGSDTENSGFELSSGVWHSWIPIVNNSIFIEVKQGPYAPQSASEFAAWSPPEGDERVTDFLEKMRSLTIGSSVI